MGELQPRMRAGDADRAKTVERLGRHLAEGRLTVDEFDERVSQAHAAVHLDELPPLLADLPPDPPPLPARRPSRPPSWATPAALVVLTAMLLSFSAVMALHGIPPVLPLLLLFALTRHRRWHRRW
jgi:Domain of unknown function (DUF1707)